MSPEARTPLDVYLDAVDLSLLRSGASRSRRIAIVRDLESTVLEMMRERLGEREAAAADVAALLATLDAPEAYVNVEGAAAPRVSAGRRKLPGNLKWAGLLIPVGAIGMLILMNVADEMRRQDPQEWLMLMIAAAPVVLMLCLSSILGVAAVRQVWGNPQRYWGLPLAVIACLPLPVLLLVASPLLFLALAVAVIFLFIVHKIYDLPLMVRRFVAE